MIPGSAPATPPVQESLAFEKCPWWSSLVPSPMYQTFPCLSWAYQSKVRSTGWPCWETVSRMTVAGTPMIVLVRCVTTSLSVCFVLPSSATPS